MGTYIMESLVSLNLNDNSPTRPHGGYTLVRSNGVLHTKRRVDRDTELTLFHHLHEHDGVVLARRRAEHDIAAWHTAEPRGAPGIEYPIPNRGA